MDEVTVAERIEVLIVDDDQIIADILKEVVDGPGRSVGICHDGLEAIERIQKQPFDLIIVDLSMPRIGGLEVLKYVKKVHPETLVIIHTGYASLETAMTAIKEGAYDYIRKPCKLAEMSVVVDRATDKIRLNRENRALLQQLQAAYQDLLVCKDTREEGPQQAESIRFLSSNQTGLHHLFNGPAAANNNEVEKLHALSGLRENGMLTESEYTRFKQHLLNAVESRGSDPRAINNR